MELCAGVVAIARNSHFSASPEEVSNVCTLLKGLTLGPDCLLKLGLNFDWLVIPNDEELSILDIMDILKRD
jgi:hypothetical protein